MTEIRKNIFWVVAFLLFLGNMGLHFEGSSALKPSPAEALVVSATYNENWAATEVALTQISDWSGWWYYSYLAAQYQTTTSVPPGWLSGRSRSVNSSMYWYWYYWWYWYYYGNSSGAMNDLSPHGFVTKWHVNGTLNK